MHIKTATDYRVSLRFADERINFHILFVSVFFRMRIAHSSSHSDGRTMDTTKLIGKKTSFSLKSHLVEQDYVIIVLLIFCRAHMAC